MLLFNQYDLNGSGKVDYFNTSNVTIQLEDGIKLYDISRFQYI